MSEQKEPKAPKDGVGKAAMAAIRAGKSNEEVLAIVQAKFPDSKTTKASVNWYRNKLRADDPSIKTSRELRASAKPAKAPKAKKAKDPLD